MDRPAKRVVRTRLAVAAVFALPAVLLLFGGMSRSGHDRDLDRRGRPVTAVVVARSGTFPLPNRVLIRYDVDDGSLVRADVWTPRSNSIPVGDTIAAVYDPSHPTRARVFRKDPLLPSIWGAAAAFGLLALGFAGAALFAILRSRQRARAARKLEQDPAAAGTSEHTAEQSAAQPAAPPFRVARFLIPRIGIALVLALLGAAYYYVAGPGGRHLLEASADRRAPACGKLESLLPGRPSTPGPTNTGEATEKDVADLPLLLFNRPPDGLGFGNEKIEGAPLSLQEAAKTRRDPEEGARVLTRYGYIGGYRRDWQGPNATDLTEFAYALSSKQNALAFDAYASRYLCLFDEEVFAVSGIPGAVGHRFRVASGSIVEQVSWVQGTQRFLVGLTNVTETGRGRHAIEVVARLAYARAQRHGDLIEQPTTTPTPRGQATKPPRSR